MDLIWIFPFFSLKCFATAPYGKYAGLILYDFIRYMTHIDKRICWVEIPLAST